MVFEPGLGLPAGVLGVIVLLEHHITWGFSIIIEGSLEIILHNPAVDVSIHPPINLACISWPFPGHTAPQHKGTTTKLLGPFHQSVRDSLPSTFPYPVLPIRAQQVSLGT